APPRRGNRPDFRYQRRPRTVTLFIDWHVDRGLTMGISRWLLAAALLVPILALAQAQGPDERQAKQKAIKAETDKFARRIETMARLLEYDRIAPSDEALRGKKKLLDEVHRMLAGVSQ